MKRPLTNLALTMCLSPLLMQCAAEKDVQDLDMRLRTTDTKSAETARTNADKKDVQDLDIRLRTADTKSAETARTNADKKAKSAVDNLKQALMSGQQAATGKASASTVAPQAGSGTGSGGGMVDENLRRYMIAVSNQIHKHWNLPDLQNWKENVEAFVIIRVRRDGAVVETTFKKKSDDVFFNQLVEETLRLSSPLPPFPIGMNQSEMEFGLKFRPEKIF